MILHVFLLLLSLSIPEVFGFLDDPRIDDSNKEPCKDALSSYVDGVKKHNGRRLTEAEKLRVILMVKVYGGNVSIVAKKLGLNQVTVYRWVRAYEKKHGVQIRNAKSKQILRKDYKTEYKLYAIGQVKDNGGNMAEVARELNIPQTTLLGWVHSYIDNIVFKFSRNGSSSFELNYSKEQKSLAIELVKVVGGDVFRVKEELSISLEDLDNIIMEYEITTDDIIIGVYEIKKIVGEFNRIKNELDGLRRINIHNKYSDRERSLAIELIEVVDGNIATAARRLKIPSSTLGNWWKKNGHER